MYNQIWTKILDSSIWLEDTETRIVWITFLAMMDKNGMVRLSSIGNVANRARVSIEAAQAAIDCLSDPDAYNPDQEHEGRRIERIPGEGWRVINKGKYQKMMTEARKQMQSAESSKAYRKRQKESVTHSDTTVTHRDKNVTLSESESNTESDTDQESIKRLIDDARKKFPDRDGRFVEMGVIETMLNRNGSAEKISSLSYFLPQIDRLARESQEAGNSDATIDVALQSHRKRAGLG